MNKFTIAVIFLFIIQTRAQRPGDLDSTYGINGMQTITLMLADAASKGVTIQEKISIMNSIFFRII